MALVLVCISATIYRNGIMVTMDAKEGIEMFKIINPKKAIPIHYNDYDVFQSPLEDFKRRVKEEGLEVRVHYLTHGDICF
jgi:L-ascorbate metabolism protein UlaG (beta-lactamase superfamily)